jgi:thymidylate kinase
VEVHQDINEEIIVKELIKYKENPIYRIAITGGPCAGKSTALTTISKYFSKAGFHVMVVPEIPTIVAHGGGLKDFYSFGSKDRMHFQLDLIKLKIYFEDYIAKLADMAKKPTLILCDRGIVDCAAYMSGEEYQALLDESGWTWSYVRDKRYDSVIFMNTAAKGAEEYYTL